MMTKAPVNTSAAVGEETTYWKATRYICVGSVARCAGTRYSIARKARNDPASCLSAPRTIQPGPAARFANHQARPCAARAGWKRRKSTCSPICAINENTTVEAAPNNTRLNAGAPPRSEERREGKSVDLGGRRIIKK